MKQNQTEFRDILHHQPTYRNEGNNLYRHLPLSMVKTIQNLAFLVSVSYHVHGQVSITIFTSMTGDFNKEHFKRTQFTYGKTYRCYCSKKKNNLRYSFVTVYKMIFSVNVHD